MYFSHISSEKTETLASYSDAHDPYPLIEKYHNCKLYVMHDG